MEYPSEGTVEPLGNVAKVISGYAFKSSSFRDDGVPVIKIANIRRGFVDLSDVQYVDPSFLSLDRKYHVASGDILISLTGSHVTQPGSVVGRVALHSAYNGHCLLNQRAGKVIVTRPDRCNAQYLFYMLSTDDTQRSIGLMAHGAASQANLSPTQVESVDLPLPPLPVQHRIASILSAYDNLIENNTQRIKALEAAAQTLYREWFVEFRFPGWQQVEWVEIGEGRVIPEGWEWLPLSSLVDTQYGYTESAQNNAVGPKYLRGMDINKTSYVDWSSVPYCPISEDDFEKYKLSIGDIVVIRMADPGKVGIVEKDVEAVFASYLIRLLIKSEKLLPYYLFYFLSSERYQGYITGASTGTTRKSASAGVVIGIDLAVPPHNLLDMFEEQIRDFRQMLNNLLERNATLRETRDLLLPRLISGELSVEGVPLPEES